MPAIATPQKQAVQINQGLYGHYAYGVVTGNVGSLLGVYRHVDPGAQYSGAIARGQGALEDVLDHQANSATASKIQCAI